MAGNNVSHAQNKRRRRFLPNLHYHRFWVESEKRYVKLRVSSKGMRVVDKKGIDAVLRDLRKAGQKVQVLGKVMRDLIKLESSAGTGHYYTTTKNKRNSPDKLEMKKFDPVIRKHVLYTEGKIK